MLYTYIAWYGTQKMMIIEMNMNFQINPFALNSVERTNTKRKITSDTSEEEKVSNLYCWNFFLSVWCSMLMDAFSASFFVTSIHVHPKKFCIWKQIDSAYIYLISSVYSARRLMLLSYHFQFDYFFPWCGYISRALFRLFAVAVCSVAPRDLCFVKFK